MIFSAVALSWASATPAAATESEGDLALTVLESIEVSEDVDADYDREDYAPRGWVDATGSGCTTREDILARDMDPGTLEVDDDGCTVLYGETTGAYSGEWIEHVQGDSEIDIEHVVAIGQAHRNGGHEWDSEQREEFYQDPENLLAVSASENRSKGDRDLTEYLPPNQGATCEFVAAKVYVKDKYELTMTPQEHELSGEILSEEACEGTPAAPAQAMYTTDWDTAEAPEVSADESDQESAVSSGGGSGDPLADVQGWVEDLGAPGWVIGAGVLFIAGAAAIGLRRIGAAR